MDLDEKVEKSADFLIKLLGNQTPRSAMICGSGWAKVADDLKIIEEISYDEITALTNTQVEGHKSVLKIVETEKGLTLLFLGRRHYYEGEGWGSVIAPILLIHALGIDKLVLTNAAGGINEDFDVGDIMLVEDHINMMGNNPLIGGNIHPDIPRFPDQTNIYNAELRNLVETQALECNIKTREGIYLAVSGPSFETPAEIRAFKKMGADAVGMSTVPEAIVANSLKMKICALSLISNQAAGKSSNELSHEEVSETANQILPKMKVLVTQILNSL